MKKFYVYIITNKYNSIYYVGVTNNLKYRIYVHKNKLNEGFSKKYNLYKLVYFEEFNNFYDAALREKQIKHYSRKKKIALIIKDNPDFDEIVLN